MQTEPCADLVTVEGEGEARKEIRTKQHRHQCTWCGRMFGEFTDEECKNGHGTADKCCSECEESNPARLNDERGKPLHNPIANANRKV